MSEKTGRVTEGQLRRELRHMYDRQSRRRTRIGALVIIALAAALGALVARYMFVLADIRTDGLADALRGGDVALCVRRNAPLLGRAPRRGELALVRYTDNGLVRQTVRRVIAVGGDEVSVEADGRVVLNGAAVEEPYARYRALNDWSGEATPGGALENPFADEAAPRAAAPVEQAPGVDDLEYPVTVAEGWLFVLCDDRENAMDSRSSCFGLVSEADVQGLARAVIWPAYRVGLLGGDGA